MARKDETIDMFAIVMFGTIRIGQVNTLTPL